MGRWELLLRPMWDLSATSVFSSQIILPCKKFRVKEKLDETSGTAATSLIVVSKNLAN